MQFRQGEHVDISTRGEAVYRTFAMEEDVGEVICFVKAEGIEDGPLLVPCDDVTQPIDPTDGGGGEVVLGGAGCEDDLVDEPALAPEQRQGDIDGGHGVEEAEHAVAGPRPGPAIGEVGDPPVVGAEAAPGDGPEAEGAAGGERGVSSGSVLADEKERGRRLERHAMQAPRALA